MRARSAIRKIVSCSFRSDLLFVNHFRFGCPSFVQDGLSLDLEEFLGQVSEPFGLKSTQTLNRLLELLNSL